MSQVLVAVQSALLHWKFTENLDRTTEWKKKTPSKSWNNIYSTVFLVYSGSHMLGSNNRHTQPFKITPSHCRCSDLFRANKKTESKCLFRCPNPWVASGAATYSFDNGKFSDARLFVARICCCSANENEISRNRETSPGYRRQTQSSHNSVLVDDDDYI